MSDTRDQARVGRAAIRAYVSDGVDRASKASADASAGAWEFLAYPVNGPGRIAVMVGMIAVLGALAFALRTPNLSARAIIQQIVVIVTSVLFAVAVASLYLLLIDALMRGRKRKMHTGALVLTWLSAAFTALVGAYAIFDAADGYLIASSTDQGLMGPLFSAFGESIDSGEPIHKNTPWMVSIIVGAAASLVIPLGAAVFTAGAIEAAPAADDSSNPFAA